MVHTYLIAPISAILQDLIIIKNENKKTHF